MKLLQNERQKHYLVGILVIFSIGVVFLPSFLKKANDHYEDNISISVRLPTKPEMPKVTVPEEKKVFQSVKVAHVDLSSESQIPKAPRTVKAEAISTKRTEQTEIKLAKEEKTKDPVKRVPAKPSASQSQAVINPRKAVPVKNSVYSVQLASFIHKNNAESLVSRLRKQGYTAYYNIYTGKKKTYYKVYVGHITDKSAAKTLQQQLADRIHLKGLVIKTGVS